jgi:hypothetical protein
MHGGTDTADQHHFAGLAPQDAHHQFGTPFLGRRIVLVRGNCGLGCGRVAGQLDTWPDIDPVDEDPSAAGAPVSQPRRGARANS